MSRVSPRHRPRPQWESEPQRKQRRQQDQNRCMIGSLKNYAATRQGLLAKNRDYTHNPVFRGAVTAKIPLLYSTGISTRCCDLVPHCAGATGQENKALAKSGLPVVVHGSW